MNASAISLTTAARAHAGLDDADRTALLALLTGESVATEADVMERMAAATRRPTMRQRRIRSIETPRARRGEEHSVSLCWAHLGELG